MNAEILQRPERLRRQDIPSATHLACDVARFSGRPEDPVLFLVLRARAKALAAEMADGAHPVGWSEPLTRQIRRRLIDELPGIEEAVPADETPPWGNAASEPPRALTYLLYMLLPQAERDALLPSLKRAYAHEVLPAFGLTAASLWYAKQVLSAIVMQNPLWRWLLLGGGLIKLLEWTLRWKRGP